MAKTYVTIIDNTGRNILGLKGNETDNTLDILSPVMITVQPQNGQFQVQLIPLFLAEFITPDPVNARNFTFTYTKANVAIGSGFRIDEKITSQYDKILEASNNFKQPDAAPAAEAKPEVIKLFED